MVSQANDLMANYLGFFLLIAGAILFVLSYWDRSRRSLPILLPLPWGPTQTANSDPSSRDAGLVAIHFDKAHGVARRISEKAQNDDTGDLETRCVDSASLSFD